MPPEASRIKHHLVLMLFVLAFGSASAQTSNTFKSAYVGAGSETGQAILFMHGNKCFALTPAHVIDKAGGDLFDVEISGSSKQAKGIYQEINRFDSSLDLSLGLVKGSIATECGGQFDTIQVDVSSALERSAEGSVHVVNSNGQTTRFRALIESSNHQLIFLGTGQTSKQIMKGMSGSLIAVGNSPVGMLLTGEGKALRIDRIAELVRPFIEGMEKGIPNARLPNNTPNKNWLNVELVYWTGEAVASANAVQNLLESTGNNTVSTAQPYLIKKPERPAEVVFAVKGGTQISRIQILGSSLKNSPKLVKSVEVMIDSNGSSRWRSVAHGEVPLGEGSVELEFAPQVAKAVMIRLYSNWGHPTELGLDKVYFYSN